MSDTQVLPSGAPTGQPPPSGKGKAAVLIVVSGVGLLLLLLLLSWRASARVNHDALSKAAKPVTVIEATAAKYRQSRNYVATVEPWASAKLGPQMVSAYVDTVLVRPGSVVKKGDVLATLDCRGASAQSQAVAMQARALDTRQKALANEASRLEGLVGKGFVAENEAEQKAAQSAAEQSSLLATRARLLGTSLEVNDCILRAPFDGEVTSRMVDPGAFVKPGIAIAELVDRSTVRITGEAPETEFGVVNLGTRVAITLVSTKKELVATVSRRAPSADPQTRTIHFEIDVADAERSIPVGTTAELRIDVGEPMNVTEVPLVAAVVKGSKASLFVLEGDVVKSVSVNVKGEAQGKLYLATELKPGSKVVTEGRALLNDGDKVNAKIASPPQATATASSAAPASAAPTSAAPTASGKPAASGQKQ
jgi:membrane fusion protein, multidrug efflux system